MNYKFQYFTTIVSLKAFGDFLIAYSALLRASAANPASDIRLLAGEHVRPLGLALEVPEAKVQYIGGSLLKDVPEAFDFRRRGLWKSCLSLAKLRRDLLAAQLGDRQILFDRIGLRERFISSGRLRIALPAEAQNIYLAYEAHFLVDTAPTALFGLAREIKHALIVPASRVPNKVIPREVIQQVCQQLAAKGIVAHVLLLEGEKVEVPQSVALIRLPRQFSALMASLRETDMVVSADSLPAHIGEHLGKPTFVISPVPNPYWLPRMAFLKGGHGVFGNLGNLSTWLEKSQAYFR
jgi:hypothetical protein